MPLHQSAGLRRRQVRVERAGLARLGHLDHRRAMAHPHAADTLYQHIRARRFRAFPQRMEQPVAALGHAT